MASNACDGWVGEIEECMNELEKVSSQSPRSIESEEMKTVTG